MFLAFTRNGHTDGYFGKLDLADDIGLCKQTIKKRLGFDDVHLCWSRGAYDENSIKIAKDASLYKELLNNCINSVADFRNGYIFFGQYSAIKTEVRIPIGTPIIIAPAVT